MITNQITPIALSFIIMLIICFKFKFFFSFFYYSRNSREKQPYHHIDFEEIEKQEHQIVRALLNKIYIFRYTVVCSAVQFQPTF